MSHITQCSRRPEFTLCVKSVWLWNMIQESIINIQTVELRMWHQLAFPPPLCYYHNRWSCVTYHRYLVGVVEEVNRDAERQRVVVGVPQQDGKDLHTGRPALPLPLLLGPLHGPLAVDGILTHLSPEDNRETMIWYSGTWVASTSCTIISFLFNSRIK